MYEQMSISQAAKLLNISTEGVRQRIKRGKLASTKGEDGRTYVTLDTTEQEANNTTNGFANTYINTLTSQIDDLKADKEDLKQEVLRHQQIIAGLVSKIPDPQEQPQESVVLRELTGAAQEVGEKAVKGLSRWSKWLRS